jgi:uncharacterized membrane protein YphA (DoxX/SURF4 family)
MTFNPSSKFSCSSRTSLYAMMKTVFQGSVFLELDIHKHLTCCVVLSYLFCTVIAFGVFLNLLCLLAGAQNFVCVWTTSQFSADIYAPRIVPGFSDANDGLTWMWILLLQFTAWCNSDVQQAQINHQLDATISLVYYPDVYLQFNMFWASSHPSSGAQQLQ